MTIRESHSILKEGIDELKSLHREHVENHNTDIDRLNAFKNQVKGGLALIALLVPTLLYMFRG